MYSPCASRPAQPIHFSCQQIGGGGGGIRTHGWLPIGGFQDRCHKPLDHPSRVVMHAMHERPPGASGQRRKQVNRVMNQASRRDGGSGASVRECPPRRANASSRME